MEVVLVLWLVCAIVGALILSRFNWAGTGLILGIVLGPVGLIAAYGIRRWKLYRG